MTVAAHNGHARLRDAEFGADDVYDALLPVAKAVEFDAECLAIFRQFVHLKTRQRLADGQVLIDGGHVVIGGGDGLSGPEHRYAALAQSVESLWTGDFVNEVAIYVEHVLPAFDGLDDVCVPDFVKKGEAGHYATAILLNLSEFLSSETMNWRSSSCTSFLRSATSRKET